MLQIIASHPRQKFGKRSDPKSQSTFKSQGRDYFKTLPYDSFRAMVDCSHSPLYLLSNYEEQPLFCGLCFFREGWESEIPGRVHEYKTLAENGNPETSPKFLAHLYLAMGLQAPELHETTYIFRRNRKRLAREQYSSPAWGIFPVSSSLWQLMGYQPPLAKVLIPAAYGRDELTIAAALGLSLVGVHITMAKAIRTAMGFLVHEKARSDHSRPRNEDITESSEELGRDEPGFEGD